MSEPLDVDLEHFSLSCLEVHLLKRSSIRSGLTLPSYQSDRSGLTFLSIRIEHTENDRHLSMKTNNRFAAQTQALFKRLEQEWVGLLSL